LLRWKIEFNALGARRKTLLVGTPILLAAFLVALHFKAWRQLPKTNVWVDILLGTFLLAIVPFAMAAYGGHVAAEGVADSKRRRSIKAKFWIGCVVGVVLAFFQQYRSLTNDAVTKSKTEKVESAILGQLSTLHDKGSPLTANEVEAKRRSDILTALRSQYVLQHDNLPEGILDGTEPLPADWVNEKLHDLKEDWAVSTPEPKPGISRPKTYVVFSGAPKFPGRQGSEGSNFQIGEALAFNLYYAVSGPNALKILRIERLLMVEPNFEVETQKNAIAEFIRLNTEERKQGSGPPHTMMPSDTRFNTAFSYTDTEPRQSRTVSQLDLNSLKTGTEIAFLLAEITYQDGGETRHLKRCMFLQPPAQPPGIWHFCENFND
jgi:hypothetical protein